MAPAPAPIPSLDAQPIRPRFLRVRLDHLFPSADNPRKTRDGDPSLKELAESLRTLGQIEPIVAQELEHSPEEYEILAGERRWRAAKMAGLTELEVKVGTYTDQQALEITVVENLQRADLDPLSEARGVATLLSRGWDVPTVASHLGKSVRWVHLRAGLTKLTQAWTDALALLDNDVVSLLGAGHLELIARLAPDQQDAALKEIDKLGKEWNGSALPIDEFSENLSRRFTRDLTVAHWDLHDGNLVPKAGSCAACPKRASCQQQIFGELVDAIEAGKRADHCLDEKCWAKKETAWLKSQEVKAKERHGDDLLKIDPDKHYGTGKALGENEYTKVKADTKGAKPALIVAGANAGKTVWVKPKDSGRASQPRTPDDDLKAQAKREGERITNQRVDFISEMIHSRMSSMKTVLPTDETLVRMAAMLLQDWNQRGQRAFDLKVKTDTLRAELWKKLSQEFETTGCEESLCELIGLHHAALVASAAAKFPDLSEGVAEAKVPVGKGEPLNPPRAKSAKAAKAAKAVKKSTGKQVVKKTATKAAKKKKVVA